MVNPGLVRPRKRLAPERVDEGLYVFHGAYTGEYEFFDRDRGDEAPPEKEVADPSEEAQMVQQQGD